MKKVLRLLPVFVLCVAAGQQVVAQKLTLNLPKAVSYQAVTELKMVNSVEAMGQNMEITADSRSTTLFEVKDVRSNEYDVVKTVKKLAVNMVVPGQEISYDSEKKDNNDKTAKAMGAKVGKAVNMTIDKEGTIIKQDAPIESGEEDIMGGMMQNIAMKETDELYVAAMLNRTVKPGEQWQDSLSTKSDKMSTKTAGVYTVKTVENGIATIVYDGVQSLNGTMEQNGMDMTLTGTNKINTELLVDVKSGLTLQRKGTITINNTIEVMGMSMPSTGTVSINSILKPVQ